MTQKPLSRVLGPDQLETQIGTNDLLLIDLSKPATYAKMHIPGAVHLDYAQITMLRKPVMGLLPDADTLSRVFSGLGLRPNTPVVAYDDEGGGRAARLLWTLDAIGHPQSQLLNGGLHAWVNENHLRDNTPVQATPSVYQVTLDNTPIADRAFILQHLDDPAVALLDSRSAEEFRGEKKFAARAGHIPGAVNLDWLLLMDKSRNLRLRPEAELHALLEERGIRKDQTVVTYCQTHHRSALTYFVLKALGFANVKGYPGSWSDWGNCDDTPVETG
jgi:thiosulfate/3-mercaptopyruvate sulfurtransferase